MIQEESNKKDIVPAGYDENDDLPLNAYDFLMDDSLFSDKPKRDLLVVGDHVLAYYV